MSKVSIIIPVYNAELYIEQCIRSVLQQTLDDIEIIIIDDGCTDKSCQIIEELIAGYHNVFFYHQSNQGLYKTREIALSYAHGEYIGWVDADDYVDTTMFEKMYNTAIKNNSELVFCDYTWFPSKITTKEKWFREYKGKVDVHFVERNSQPWNKIVKHDLIRKLNIGPCFVSCFDEIYIRVLMEAKKPVAIKESLYYYRVGNGTMSSSYKNVEHYRKFVVSSIELKKIMVSTNINDYWTDYFDYRIIYYLLMTMLVAANSGDKKSYLFNKKELLLIKPKYNKNRHYKPILNENFGSLKSFVIRNMIPSCYIFARMICLVGMR